MNQKLFCLFWFSRAWLVEVVTWQVLYQKRQHVSAVLPNRCTGRTDATW